MTEPQYVRGTEAVELLKKVVEGRWSGERKVEASGVFEGTHLLEDGRVIEVNCNCGWFRTASVFESTEAWMNYKHTIPHNVNPALKFN